jgi:hypothetical protein
VRSAPVAAIDAGQFRFRSVATNLDVLSRGLRVEERLLSAIQGLIRRGDELHAQHVAQLERNIAGLHDVLRDLASAAMKLADITPPSDPTDAAVVDDVVSRARKVIEYLDPPSH